MKVLSSVSKRCPKCQLVRRSGALYIICTATRRHSQRQGTKIRKKAG